MTDNGQYPGQPQYPGFTPQQPAPQQPVQPPYPAQPPYPSGQYPVGGYGAAQRPATPGGIAIAALVVGIVAFVLGWIPILGLIIAAVGVVLGIVALRKAQNKGLSWAGIGLSALAALASIIMTIVFVVLPLVALSTASSGSDPAPYSGGSGGGSDGGSTDSDVATWSTVSGNPIDTPCWSYDGPKYFINNISQTRIDACMGALELWGEWQSDGTFKPTGAGDTAGQIQVDVYSAAELESFAPGGDADSVVDALEAQQYFSQQGTIIALHESITIGGVPATITRIDSTASTTKTKAFITVVVPDAYPIADTDAKLFIISVTTPYDNGEEQIQQVVDSWVWK